ncbi:MAG TPA: DUF3662 and FHA domain-containing protein [Actinomycetota bacterium]
MGILRDFEGRLERIVEGFFSKAFRSGLQPVELAKRILREMDAGKTVGVSGVLVPNRFVVVLSEEDRERLTGMESALSRELETVVVDGAREREFTLVARPEVVFETAERLKRGDFRIQAEISEATGPPPADVGPRPGGGGPLLALVEGGDALREYPITSDRMTIGRLAGSEIELHDPGASRKHAEIRRRGDTVTVVDLGSTNGTLVNDRTITDHVLRDGDRIRIGRTTLEFRSG